MSIEFLGNKRQIESFIIDNINEHTDSNCKTCFDIFSGSGSISLAMKKNGYQVYANDFLYFSTILTAAVLLNDEAPHFESINLPDFTSDKSRYQQILDYLNGLEGKEGFIYSHYSPASSKTEDVERMYFTKINAKKIDAIREQIALWDDLLKENEKSLLISDLLKAVAAVSNIAGTYGCYMKYWKRKAQNDLILEASDFTAADNGVQHIVYNEDANKIVENVSVDIIYADPPYTKRQYSAYYHILETIALNDRPDLIGSTGLRNWKEKSSDYCYKRKAAHSLEDLVQKSKCRYFVLSYNDESQITHEKVVDILEKYGKVVICETPYKRYKSNNTKGTKTNVLERLYILKMENEHATSRNANIQ